MWIDIVPVPKGRPRVGKYGNVYTPERTRLFEASVKLAVQRLMDPMSGQIALDVVFHVKREADLDNLIKAFLDACNGVAFEDDRQVAMIIARRVKNPKRPGIEFEFRPC